MYMGIVVASGLSNHFVVVRSRRVFKGFKEIIFSWDFKLAVVQKIYKF